MCSLSRNSFITVVYSHESKEYGYIDLKEQPVLKNNKIKMCYFKDNISGVAIVLKPIWSDPESVATPIFAEILKLAQ